MKLLYGGKKTKPINENVDMQASENVIKFQNEKRCDDECGSCAKDVNAYQGCENRKRRGGWQKRWVVENPKREVDISAD